MRLRNCVRRARASSARQTAASRRELPRPAAPTPAHRTPNPLNPPHHAVPYHRSASHPTLSPIPYPLSLPCRVRGAATASRRLLASSVERRHELARQAQPPAVPASCCLPPVVSIGLSRRLSRISHQRRPRQCLLLRFASFCFVLAHMHFASLHWLPPRPPT